ncbi:MAG: DUF6580 family putative transport protein [Bacteroidota bacterium]
MRNILISSALILAAALSRILPHPDNFTPIAAMALAGGVYFNKRIALVVPLAALVISDLFIGFHNTILFVYGSFLLIGLIGLWLKSHKKPLPIFGATLFSSILFFVVTNFGVWLTGGGWFYPKTWQGLIECYTLAIPFFRNTVAGDLVYTVVLFGLFELSGYTLRSVEKKAVRI